MLAHEVAYRALNWRHGVSPEPSGVEALDAHPVISRRHMRRQPRAQGFVIEIGMQVGEDRAPRTYDLDPRQGLVEAEMGGVSAIAQGVDDPHVQASEKRAACLGNAFHIRGVSERPEAKAERADIAVVEIERHRLDGATRALDATDLPSCKAPLSRNRRIRTAVRGLKNI